MDLFAGRTAWHVSIAHAVGDGFGLPLPMSKSDARFAVRLATKLLDGAGDVSTERRDPSHRVVHVRRALTRAEEAQLPRAFLERPATDGGGNGGLLDALATWRTL